MQAVPELSFEKKGLIPALQQFNKAIKDYIDTANKKLEELISQLSKHTFQLDDADANPLCYAWHGQVTKQALV